MTKNDISKDDLMECANLGLTILEAAEYLCIGLTTIKRKLKRYELNAEYSKIFKQKQQEKQMFETLEIINSYDTIIDAIRTIDLESFTLKVQKLYKAGLIQKGKCDMCNNEHEYEYGSGVFCSAQCSRSYSTKNLSDESIEKRNRGLETGRESQHTSWEQWREARDSQSYTKDELDTMRVCLPSPLSKEQYDKIWTPEAREKAGNLSKEYYANPDNKEKIEASKRTIANGKISDKERILRSERAKENFRQGKIGGWKPRNERYYSEIFWREILDKHNYSYQEEVYIKNKDLGENTKSGIFLDFLLIINGRKINIEIDGNQHYTELGIKNDTFRDNLLKLNGYNVYRIRWRNPHANDKSIIKNQEMELIKYLESFK